jgi:hypothetical protein
MRFSFILAEEAVWPVSVMCEVLQVSRKPPTECLPAV